jgi:Tfp pilus assembly protein PilF
MFKKSLFLLFCITFTQVYAQDKKTTDTIELANSLVSSKKYTQAISLLESMAATSPNNLEPLRLHGKILYWMNDFDGALLFYKKASVKHPSIQLDQAKLLLDLYRLNEAREVFTEYLKKDSKNIDALNSLGLIAYYQGRTQSAKEHFSEVNKIAPENEQANKYTAMIADAARPNLHLYGSYADDSQPLTAISSGADFDWYYNYLLAPKLNVQTRYFNSDTSKSNLYAIYLGNRIYSSSLQLNLFLGGGLYVSPVDKKTNLMWDILLSKKLANNFSLDISATHKPYFNTLASLQQNVEYYNYGVSFFYNKVDSWMWQIGYIAQQFNDKNILQNINAYVVSQPIKLGDVNFYLGYAFSYGSSKTDHFTATSSIAEAFATNNYNPVYTPYYTPKDELENAVLANLVYKPIKAIKLALNSRAGFYATSDRGFFYLEKNNGGGTIIAKDFSSQKFTPYQINGQVSYSPSSSFTLNADYTYGNTFFYHIKTASLGLNLKF